MCMSMYMYSSYPHTISPSSLFTHTHTHTHTHTQTAAGGGLRLSFLLSITDSRKVTTYCAFCFPYSYTECQRRLSRLDDTFGSDGACQRPGDGTMHQKDHATPNMYYHRYIITSQEVVIVQVFLCMPL